MPRKPSASHWVQKLPPLLYRPSNDVFSCKAHVSDWSYCCHRLHTQYSHIVPQAKTFLRRSTTEGAAGKAYAHRNHM